MPKVVDLFVPDGWLSQTIGHPCYRFADANVGDVDVDVTVNKMSELSRGCQQTFFFAKVPTQSVSAVANLERCGFGVVDTNVVLQWVGKSSLMGNKKEPKIIVAEPSHFSILQDIAARSFSLTRFHLDPKFLNTTADLLKRKWVESYSQGTRGSVIYTAMVGDMPVGFLAVLQSDDGRQSAAIDLIGVAPEFQGKRIGKALVSHFVCQWQDRADRLLVGTQVANVRSMAFYEGQGFRTSASHYVLHAHYQSEMSCK